MPDTKQIFEQIRRSEMNDWVGGLDPELIGDACARILDRYITLDSQSRLLDFGCGVGRVLLSVLRQKPQLPCVAGFDILPQAIDFCEAHIATGFPQATFELIQGRNEHYERFVALAGGRPASTHAQLRARFGARFTDVYAFSVFTHVEQADFSTLLALLSDLLAPGGTLLFTAFLLTAFSRGGIQRCTTIPKFANPAMEGGDTVFVGDMSDRLAFIAFDSALVERMIFEAGLVMTHVEHGSWSNGNVFFSPSMQDVVVCRRPIDSHRVAIHDGADRT